MTKKQDDVVVTDEAPSIVSLYVNVDVNQLLTERTEAQVYQFLANLKDLLRG